MAGMGEKAKGMGKEAQRAAAQQKEQQIEQ
jgi:hypothetical protein